jgi:hypothetical protein
MLCVSIFPTKISQQRAEGKQNEAGVHAKREYRRKMLIFFSLSQHPKCKEARRQGGKEATEYRARPDHLIRPIQSHER